MIANIVLDYLECAAPLKAGTIKLDINHFQNQYDREPSRIIMWAHQWLWILHEAGLETYARLPWVPVLDVDIVRGENTLWGIPIEVRES